MWPTRGGVRAIHVSEGRTAIVELQLVSTSGHNESCSICN